MSEQQPKEHCEHKEICYHVWNNIGHGCPYDNDDQNPEKKTCKHDTRSRPHPAPRPPCEECIYQAQAADIARKAREQVLQQVIDYCNKEAKENPDDEAWYDSTMEKVADYCESLRAQQAGDP